jgi:hypothetical protein
MREAVAKVRSRAVVVPSPDFVREVVCRIEEASGKIGKEQEERSR